MSVTVRGALFAMLTSAALLSAPMAFGSETPAPPPVPVPGPTVDEPGLADEVAMILAMFFGVDRGQAVSQAAHDQAAANKERHAAK